MSAGWGTSGKQPALPEQAAGPSTSEEPKHPAQPAGDWGQAFHYDYTETDVDRQWGGNGAVYEWQGEEGDLAPEDPILEAQLFGEPDMRFGAGLDISKIYSINVSQEGEKRIAPIFKFEAAGLHPVMLKNVQMCGYDTPTPIQKYCIPAINMGYDLIAIAQTGSGKTAAYLIPILNQLMGKAKKLAAYRPTPQQLITGEKRPVRAEPLVLVICPTRELAIQIFNEARKFCYRTMLRPCVVYGGAPISDQIKQIGGGCDLLIATPGRLVDLMARGHLLTLRRLRYMVVDEADEMLDTDWQQEFAEIFSGGDHEEDNVQYMLFSATFPAAVRRLARDHLASNHLRVRVGRIGSTHENIKQDIVYVKPELKRGALLDLLYSIEPGRTIIFVNNKRAADEIDDFIYNKGGLPCTSMHSDRTQREREDAMRAFRAGKAPLLVTTGVSARGIDVRNVKHVINFDLPTMDHGGIQEYTHRIGRTGRIGHTGTATSFYTDRDMPLAEDLTKILMETKQTVPDFLQEYIPEGADPSNFKIEDDNSEDEDEAAGGEDPWGVGDSKPAGGDDAGVTDEGGWGTGASAGEASGTAGDGWGTGASAGETSGAAGGGWGAGSAIPSQW
ncbi:P-loop containing nucleoside triphosphate hydrolase protein [Annulohypoxylon maeteangense]|uniref:P-loop containing nucleoside triphosphate hydrolase protein n=1 Tax=Annulohypoxylon maeteangense TaxID=1927788 RepID=UPI0020076FE2|nr:P-loop containing nucleoside triphosphate hydrolase protein [Annulohypoxylon maeteangense]KAI0883750.1 P-loop containing nucleoside triphosphate hydrolase protein [Annulohypoxylon maeteangense]